MGQEGNEKSPSKVMFLAKFADHAVLGHESELELVCQRGTVVLLLVDWFKEVLGNWIESSLDLIFNYGPSADPTTGGRY